MLLPAEQLKNLPVFTRSGLKLGRVADFEIESETQSIVRYFVRQSRLVGRFQKSLMIHRSQVIFLTKEKMVVEDLVLKQAEAEKEKKYSPQPASSGVSLRQD